MRGLRVLRNGALAGRLLLCLVQPNFVGPPPEPAPPGLIRRWKWGWVIRVCRTQPLDRWQGWKRGRGCRVKVCSAGL